MSDPDPFPYTVIITAPGYQRPDYRSILNALHKDFGKPLNGGKEDATWRWTYRFVNGQTLGLVLHFFDRNDAFIAGLKYKGML